MSRTGGAAAGDGGGRGKARCGRRRLRLPCSRNDGVCGEGGKDGLPGRAEHAAAVACTPSAGRGHPGSRGASRGSPACTCRATKYAASNGQRTGRNAAEKVEEAQVDAAGMYHANMMRHTDFKQLKDGRWFLGYEDDASHRWWSGVFAHAMSASAPAVLDAAIKTHGKPAPVVPGHVIQFYARVRDPQARKGRVREAP